MGIQVLVAAMNQKDHSLVEKMNIQSDAIIANQCDFNSVEQFICNGHTITYLNFAERGVGLNRNNALMRATGDICLFADDDMVYVNDYTAIINQAFADNPDADVIIFNLYEKHITRYVNSRVSRVGYLNYLRYGTARIAFRLEPIRNNGIYFNQCYGGGTEHCHGEDSLFLTECLRKKLRIYTSTDYIASLTEERESTWNAVSKEKYLSDQGSLYYRITPKFWKFLCLQDAVRHKKEYDMKPIKAYLMMTRDTKNDK